MENREQKAIESIKIMTLGNLINLFTQAETVPSLTDAMCNVFWQCVSHLGV